MEHDPRPLHEQPQFIRAEGLAHASLLMVLVHLTTDKDLFRERGLKSLESLRTAMLSNPVSDAQLRAVDGVEEWLKLLTS
jgi:hypothetical protein